MKKIRIAMICGDFHKDESQTMQQAALKKAKELNIDIAGQWTVPGSLEVPIVLKQALASDAFDGAIVLGIIERGETQHGFVMGQSVTHAIVQLGLEFNKPVGYGIIGPGVLPTQIPPRLVGHAEAAVAAVRRVADLSVWDK